MNAVVKINNPLICLLPSISVMATADLVGANARIPPQVGPVKTITQSALGTPSSTSRLVMAGNNHLTVILTKDHGCDVPFLIYVERSGHLCVLTPLSQ